MRTVNAVVSQAAPGSPEKSLAAGICPQGQGCTAPSSAAGGLSRERGHVQLAACPATGRQLCSSAWGTAAQDQHPQGARDSFSTQGFPEELRGRAAVASLRLSRGGPRGPATQGPVLCAPLTSPFVIPVFRGATSQHLVKGPWPS